MAYLRTDDGVEIYFRDWGTGVPVVLIHGWPLNSDMWEHQATFLAEHGVRVIAYDRRGFGRSGQPWDGYDYDTFSSDLSALMERLDLRTATLVGFSMGAGEVVRYLSRYGTSRVTKAVLVSPVTPFLLKYHGNPEGIDADVFDTMEAHIRDDRPAFLEDFMGKFYGRTLGRHGVSHAVLAWSQQMALTGCLHSTLAAAKAWSTTDFRSEMKAVTVPTLVIHGTNDVTVPIDESGRRSAEMLPDATLTEYDREPHGLFITAAHRLNAELLQFIRAESVQDLQVA